MSVLTRSERVQKTCVSVVVAIYNVEDYLEECLESLVNQTLKGLEVIAVNDGSTDRSEVILRSYTEKYPQLIKAIHKSNGGLSDARNTGIEKSEGQFIGFVDGDDWVELDMFERLYSKAIASQSDIVVCGFNRSYNNYWEGHIARFNKKGAVRGTYLDYEKSVSENPRLLYASHSYAWNKIYKRSLFIESRHRFPIGQWFEDSATIYNLMLDAEKISCVFDGLYSYRVRATESITSSISPKIYDIFKSCDAVIDYYSENTNMDIELRLSLERVIQNHITRRFDLFARKTSNEDKFLALKFTGKAFSYLDAKFPGWKQREHLKKQLRKRVKVLAYFYIFYPSFLLPLRSKFERIVREKRRIRRQKSQAKLFQDRGYRVLGEISKFLHANSIIHFLDFDTLLGFVRDGSFLPGGSSICLGIFAEEDIKERITALMQDEGYLLWETYKYNNRTIGQSFFVRYGSMRLKFCFNYYHTLENVSKTYVCYQNPYVQYPKANMRSVVEISHSEIEATKDILIGGISIPIPANFEKLLAEKYDGEWRDPHKVGVYWKSTAASKLQGIAYIERSYDRPTNVPRE